MAANGSEWLRCQTRASLSLGPASARLAHSIFLAQWNAFIRTAGDMLNDSWNVQHNIVYFNNKTLLHKLRDLFSVTRA